MTKRLTRSLLIFAFILAACTPNMAGGFNPTETPRPTDLASPPGPTDTATPSAPPAPVPTDTTAPSETPPAATQTPIAVDLTPAQRAAIQALADKHNIPIGQIQLIKTEAMSWPTGCLGVVLPGVMCTKGPVEGFKITLATNGQQFEYHTNQDGTSVLDAAQQLAAIRLAVLTYDGKVQLVTPNIPLGPTYNPAFTGLLPYGGATAGTAYVLDFSQQTKAWAVDINGMHGLDFIQNPNYGLALWRGGPNVQPRLAWGTQLLSGAASALQTSMLDGSGLETLLTLPADSNLPVQLVAEAWSTDGQTLYFSKEPVGLGGYIPFAGASSLYQIDVSTKKVTDLFPFVAPAGPMTCLDAMSGDDRFVADHCTPNAVTIRDLTGGPSTTIQPPAEAAGFRLLGSARFSPDGRRLAFALAKGDPNAEQGWVAVSDSTRGSSKVILAGEVGMYYTVIGWLDDTTLLVQSSDLLCPPSCLNALWTVGIDGSKPVKVADGSFLTILDNR